MAITGYYGGKKYAPLPSGGGGSSDLSPILDVAGRPLEFPVGSSGAKAQLEEASRIVSERKATEQRKITEQKRIEDEARKKSAAASLQYRKEAARARNREEREAAAEKLSTTLGQVRAGYTGERVQSGLITSGRLGGFGGFEVTPETAQETIRYGKGQTYPKEVYEQMETKSKQRIADALQRGDTVEFVPGGVKITPLTSWEKAEMKVREKVTYPIGKKIYETTEVSIEKLSKGFGVYAPVGLGIPGMPTAITTPELRESSSGYVSGYLTGLKEKPLKTATLTGVAFVAPEVLGWVGAGSTALIGAELTKTIGTAAGLGITAVYGRSVVERVALEPTWEEKGFKLGEISATEITPFAVGGYLGVKTWPKIEGYLRTIGRKEIPIEKLVPKEVLYGDKKFVEAPSGKISGKEYLKLFKEESQILPGIKEPTLYHATGQKFWNSQLKVKYTPEMETSELKGLYGAYKISPYFLKVQGGYSLYGADVLGGYGKPGIAGIIPKKFILGYTAKPGTAFIPAIKPEVEAILPLGSEAKLLSKDFFFKWKGVRIPIDVFKATTLGGTATKGTTNLLAISSSYRPSKYSLVSPGSFLGSLLSSKSTKSYSSSIRSSIRSSNIGLSSSKSLLRSSSISPIISRKYSRPSYGMKWLLPSSVVGSSIISPSIYSSTYRIPKEPPILPFLKLKGKIGKRERKYKGYEDIAIASDLASQVLKLKPMRVSRKDIMKIAGEPLGIRRIPILID